MMSGKAVFAGLILLALLSFQTPAQADEPEKNGYLRIMYTWRVPMVQNCGTQDVFSGIAPFTIKGRTIQGIYKVDEPVPEIVPDPMGPLQYIEYSYSCGVCSFSGTLVFHEVGGKVKTVGGKEMLHFFVTYSQPTCNVDCPGTGGDMECSSSERVVDEFMTPFEDGYIVERPANAILKYAVHFD